MSVQIVNCQLGVKRVEPASYDAHGAPLYSAPSQPTALLPGKREEQPNAEWILCLDPSLWPVRVRDHVVADDGMEYVVVDSHFIPMPPLAPDEQMVGIDIDISFIRCTGNQVTSLGTEEGGEPESGLEVGRGDNPPS